MANIKISDIAYEGILRIIADDAENEARNVFVYEGQTSGIYPCSLMDGDIDTSIAHVTVTNGNHVVIRPYYTGDIRVELTDISTGSMAKLTTDKALTKRHVVLAELKAGDATRTIVRYSNDTVCAEAYLVAQPVNMASETPGFIGLKMIPNTNKTYTDSKDITVDAAIGSVVFAGKVTANNKIEFDVEWYVNDVRYI